MLQWAAMPVMNVKKLIELDVIVPISLERSLFQADPLSPLLSLMCPQSHWPLEKARDSEKPSDPLNVPIGVE